MRLSFRFVSAYGLLLLATISMAPVRAVHASVSDDADMHDKYLLHEKYEKKKKYKEYKEYKEVKEKLGFDDASVKAAAKDGYAKYKLFLKDKVRNASYARYYEAYKDYKKYRKYKDAAKYKKYAKYDKKEYDRYKHYDSSAYRAAYERYEAFMRDIGNVTTARGPIIGVGLWSVDKDELLDSPFKLSANKPFTVTDCASTVVGTVPVGENARVTYVEGSGGTLRVYNSDPAILPSTDIPTTICFQAADGNGDDMLFDVNRPDSSYDRYRGGIQIRHSYTQDNKDTEGDFRRIWVINTLPLEHYVWGFGEIGGGVEQHSRAMIVAARTYARWYLQPTVTKWVEEGFNVLSTSGSQIYRGYDYEVDHPSIPELARATNGIIMKNRDGDIVLAAYGSWTDGRTRKYEDGHWGSTCKAATSGDTSSAYPELSAVDDPYGKHPSSDTCTLAASGNHMVGLSANGSLVLARDHGWSWTRILPYYYSGISIVKEY